MSSNKNNVLGVCRISHTTPRRSQTRFDSWRGHCMKIYKQGFEIARPAAHSLGHEPSAQCVPDMESNDGNFRSTTRLAQWEEHQTKDLAVTGSNPVPQHDCKSCRARKRSQQTRGWRTDGKSAACRSSRLGESMARRQHKRDALQCVDTASAREAFEDRRTSSPRCRPWSASGNVWERSDNASHAIAQTALRIPPCDQQPLRRLRDF